MVDTEHLIPGATGARLVDEPTLINDAYELLASANAETSRERRVLKSAVRTVTIREYEHFSNLEERSRKVATLRAVREFLKVATETPSLAATAGALPAHADLLPACHPLSRRRGTDESRARWMSADPAVPEPVRPIVASALINAYDSVEGFHARERLRSHELPALIAERITH